MTLAPNPSVPPHSPTPRYIICLFDVAGITYAVSKVAGLVGEDGELEGGYWVFLSCGIGSIAAALMGCSPVIVLGESFAGVFVGGRTGLTSIVMGLCFIVAIPFAPIFKAVPLFASAPVLVLIGLDLLPLIQTLELRDVRQAFPSFCTILLMPLLFSIDRAIMCGLVVHCLIWAINAGVWAAGNPQKAACRVLFYLSCGCCPCRQDGGNGRKSRGESLNMQYDSPGLDVQQGPIDFLPYDGNASNRTHTPEMPGGSFAASSPAPLSPGSMTPRSRWRFALKGVQSGYDQLYHRRRSLRDIAGSPGATQGGQRRGGEGRSDSDLAEEVRGRVRSLSDVSDLRASPSGDALFGSVSGRTSPYADE